MSEYIEREAALEICETEYRDRLRMLDYCGDTVAWNIGGEIKALPAADVVPVVRCEDCRWYDKITAFCSIHSREYNGGESWDMFAEDDFCSHGERKDGDDDAKTD